MQVRLPNFLIVGAAKSGTTSLYHYLKQHPEVYMSPVKEPRFITSQFVKFPLRGIGDDRVEKNIIKNFGEYKKLFKNVNSEKAIGEASIDNLYFYNEAVKYIKKFLGDVKIIIILRNPLERTFSAYLMFLRNKREYLSFEEALKEEEQRKSKNWAFGWYYKSVSFYYKAVKAYLENFRQVRVYLYDDLKSNPLGLMKDIYAFLGVDTSFKPDVDFKYKIGGVPKNRFIQFFLDPPYHLKMVIKKALKFILPEEKLCKLTEGLKKINLKKAEMNPQIRQYLKNLYREDILKLQELIHRDLSRWLN